MPDWSYQPLFKPVFFRMKPETARRLALGAIGRLAMLPLGLRVIDLMGHMRPQSVETIRALERTWISRVGLGGGLSFDRASLRAFSRFGFAYLEVGPVTVSPINSSNGIHREVLEQSLIYPDRPENPGLESIAEELSYAIPTLRQSGVRLGLRLANMPGCDWEEAMGQYDTLAARLTPTADFMILDTRWWQADWSKDQLDRLIETVRQNAAGPVLLLIDPGAAEGWTDRLIELAQREQLAGFVVGGGCRLPEGRLYGAPTKTASLALITHLRARAPEAFIIGSGGVIEPQDALDLLGAGADLIQIHSGFIYAGPGLAKRINEALNRLRFPEGVPSGKDWLRQGWIGFALVAIGLMVAGSVVMYVGLTSVLLPYDEAFLGFRKTAMPHFNTHLLHFMSHDRVTLAGTALSGSVMFLFLALSGVKQGHHWAYRAAKFGIGAGFLSFFLYLGFRYFDPLHLLVCLLVLPFYLWGVFRPPVFQPERSTNLHNDQPWKNAQAGQLLFVLIGIGLVLAGVTIAGVGCTTVFVKEDLLFMHTTREAIAAISPRLIPLVSHDRASFGGCLWSVGLVELLISLHGYRQGSRWVWWALLLGGLPGFLAVLGVHFAVGYTHFVHLFPAYIAFLMYVTGLWLSYPYLCAKKA